MKVLITGSTGAVGSFVVPALEANHQLTLFNRRKIDTPHPQALGDLLSLQACQKAVEGMEAIVHIAALPEPSGITFEVNTLGTYHLLEAARIAGVQRFIFASTNCVYGHCYPISDRRFPLKYLPIDEAHPCTPEDNYGLSKMLNEQMLSLYSQNWGMRVASLRLSWVWGEKEIRWRRVMEALDLAKYAPYFWSYVDGRDVGCAFRLALEAPDLPAQGVYNITAADTVAEQDSVTLCRRFYPDIPIRTPLDGRTSFFDCTLALEAFGFKPQHSWMDQLLTQEEEE